MSKRKKSKASDVLSVTEDLSRVNVAILEHKGRKAILQHNLVILRKHYAEK